jgi:peroxiredoxin
MMKTFLLALSVTFLASCSITPAKQAHLENSYSDLQQSVVLEGSAPIDFTLNNGEGEPVTLSEQLRAHHILLLFYRGQWCPYCIDQLESLEAVLPELESYNVKLIAVSPDEASAVKNTQRQFGQLYTFLSDTKLEVTAQYGIASNDALPHPSVFLLKRADDIADSQVLWMYASEDHTVRPSGAQLKAKIEKLFN